MGTTRSQKQGLSTIFAGRQFQRGAAWGMMIIGALLAFEIFNFSTTDFALRDVLGELRFMGMRWATILAIAFCGIDFAGVARLFTPEQGRDEPAEVWYLLGAWLLAAMMNAMLTWWGVSVAIVSNGNLGEGVVSSQTMTKVVPIFVAVMVWLIRVLIIGTFSLAGDRLFSQADRMPVRRTVTKRTNIQRTPARATTAAARTAAMFRSAPKPARAEQKFSVPEPTYHNLMNSSSATQHRFDGQRERTYDASVRR
ncbi:MAG: hypothetical protein L3J16_02920 [Anaerolineales bacterium]|nr:hypothetical protein [Anaerolineales bacterium]